MKWLLAVVWLLAAVPVPLAAPSVKVRIEGLRGELETNVAAVLSIAGLAREKNLTERRIRQAHSRANDEIAQALQPFGYYRPTVDASLVQDGDRWTATYRVDPGPPLDVTHVDVRVDGAGSGDPGFRQRVDAFPLRPGDRLQHAAYEGGKDAFSSYAAANGYLDADFDVHEIRVDREKYTSDIVLHFRTGPRFLFGPVTLHQDVLDDDVLRGYVTMKEGEPFDTDKLLAFQRSLSDSPYFSRVEVTTDREHAQGLLVPVRVDLVPAARQRWHFGLGYGTDTGPRGTVTYELRRINRKGHRGEGSVIASGIEKSFTTKYIIPGRYPRTDQFTFQLGYADVRPTTSTQQLGIIGANYSRAMGRWRQSLGLSVQRERFIVGLDKGTATHLVPEGDWSFTDADDRIHPMHGQSIEFRVRGAAKGALSDTSFAQFYTRAKFIRGLGHSFRVLARAELGYLNASDFHALPPSQRLFAGGDQSIRGFSYQGIGELDTAGNVIGGERLVTTSVELESLFIEKFGRWGAAVFADGGDAAESFGFFRRRGTGVGLRWLSPIGMVRADLAVAVSEPGRPKRFHLTIGPDL